MTALDAAIRVQLDAIDETIAVEFGVTPEHYKHWAIQPTIALRAVLDRCARMTSTGEPVMLGAAAGIKRDIARALGVDVLGGGS